MRTILAAVFTLLLVHPSSTRAAEQPWSGAPFAGEPQAILAAAEAVPSGDSAAVVLLDELRYTFDDAGRATSTFRLVFRVIDASALDAWSQVETEWAPWYQERPVIEARTIGADGSVHLLDPGAVTESAARDEAAAIFSDNRILRAPLPGMAAGTVVEQVVTMRDRNPLFDTGTPGRLVFGRRVPVETTRLVIDAPASLTLRFVNKTAPRIEPVRTEANGRQRVAFESGRLEAIEDLEENTPYDDSGIPYVAFSTGSSWQEVARRYAEIVERQLGDPAAVQPFLRSAIGKSTDRGEIVKKALAAIQKNVRYAGVEVGAGSIVPRTPQEVLARKYGDCKDKATLLVSMLRAAGIPAHVALLNAGTEADIDAGLPTLGRFNHVIVRVGGEDDALWVDPTDEYSPAGVLPVPDQDRLALVASAATTGLTRTPAAESAANVLRTTHTFVLAEEGKGAVTETTEATGAYDGFVRRHAATTDRKDYRETVESAAKLSYSGESVRSVTVTDPRDLETPFRLTLEVEKIQRGLTGEADAAVAIVPSVGIELLPAVLRSADAAPRKRDFVNPLPYVKEAHYRIVPPPGFTVRPLPPSETRALGTASFRTKYEVAADGAVLATLRFDSGKRRLTPAELETTRAALVAFAQENPVVIGFDSIGWAKLNAGDVGGALAEFRRLAALHPKEAHHRTQIGRAYFIGGMGEAGREELRRAIALDPGYAPAYRMLGIALQHDLFAREFRKGFDLEGAIAAYRKAKELAPDDVTTRAELARLLARGTDGDLYGEGARLSEAIAEYEAITAELNDATHEDELLAAMAHAGRFAEMKTRAKSVKDETARLVALVVAAAATEGTDAALREAAVADPAVRRVILGQAAQRLMSLRLYPQSAALLDHVTQGAPNAAEMRPMIDTLRRAKRIEDLQLPDEPRSVPIRLMILATTAADAKAAGRELAASWLNAFEDSLGESGDEDEPSVDGRIRIDGMSSRVATEIAIAGAEVAQEGSDATGYRVQLRPRHGIPVTDPPSTYHVVRENGRYVLAAHSTGAIGVTALHFADANDLESARAWLNRAREEIGAGGADDPLSGPAFAALWPKAKPSATAEEIRAAAAALLLHEPAYLRGAIPRLLAAREHVPEPLRIRMDIALATAYLEVERVAEALPVARRVFEAAPDSEAAFTTYARALLQNGKAAEARSLAQAWLEKIPNDIDALRILSISAATDNDFEAAGEHLRKVLDHPQARPSDYNNYAWNALFTGRAIDQAIEHANRAASVSGSASALHTLAALYAEAGKSLEARTKLFEAIDAAGHEQPSSVDWYVLGRIAENYGATDAALAAYARVKAPKDVDPSSTYVLAQRRIQAMRRK